MGRGQNIFGDEIKYTGVVSKQANVEDLLGVAQTEMLKLRIESGVFRTEVRDAEACGYLANVSAGLSRASPSRRSLTPAPVRTMMFFDF